MKNFDKLKKAELVEIIKSQNKTIFQLKRNLRLSMENFDLLEKQHNELEAQIADFCEWANSLS